MRRRSQPRAAAACRLGNLPGWTPVDTTAAASRLGGGQPSLCDGCGRATLSKDIRLHEPHLALRFGTDGLDAIRNFLEDLPDYLPPGRAVMLEHGPAPGAEVRRMLGRTGSFASMPLHTDLVGRERCTVVPSALVTMLPGTPHALTVTTRRLTKVPSPLESTNPPFELPGNGQSGPPLRDLRLVQGFPLAVDAGHGHLLRIAAEIQVDADHGSGSVEPGLGIALSPDLLAGRPSAAVQLDLDYIHAFGQLNNQIRIASPTGFFTPLVRLHHDEKALQFAQVAARTSRLGSVVGLVEAPLPNILRSCPRRGLGTGEC